jgi:hypothetical protein
VFCPRRDRARETKERKRNTTGTENIIHIATTHTQTQTYRAQTRERTTGNYYIPAAAAVDTDGARFNLHLHLLSFVCVALGFSTKTTRDADRSWIVGAGGRAVVVETKKSRT